MHIQTQKTPDGTASRELLARAWPTNQIHRMSDEMFGHVRTILNRTLTQPWAQCRANSHHDEEVV